MAFAFAFFVMIAYLSYDISRRTTFPGSKSQLKERLKKQYMEESTSATGKDSTINDSSTATHR